MESKRVVLYFKQQLFSFTLEKLFFFFFWNRSRRLLFVGGFDWPFQTEPNLFASFPSNRTLDQNHFKTAEVARNRRPHAV